MACVVEHEEFERFGWISGPEYKVQCIHKGRAEALSKTLACRFALPVSHKLPSGASCGANISGKPSLCLLHHTVHRKNLHTHYWPSLFPLLLQVKLWTVPSRTPLSLPEYIWIFQNIPEYSSHIFSTLIPFQPQDQHSVFFSFKTSTRSFYGCFIPLNIN